VINCEAKGLISGRQMTLDRGQEKNVGFDFKLKRKTLSDRSMWRPSLDSGEKDETRID
jgi:hypothetical protein